MTFPVAAARTTTADPSGTQTHSIGLGSPSAGNLLVVVAASSGAGGAFVIDEAVSGPGWFVIGGGTGTNLRVAVLAKVAAGSDALTLRTINAVRMASVCYRITGHGSSVAGGATATASSTNGDPPNAAITGAAQDVLYLAALASAVSVASAAPSGYGSLTTASAGTVFMSSAELGANGTSNNPGTFTNTSQEWLATTVAIPELAITTAARMTQEAVEAVTNTARAARVTQIAAEVVSQVTVAARLTQIAVEMVSENVPDGVARPSMLFIAT